MNVEEPVSVTLTAAQWIALSGWICGRKHMPNDAEPAKSALDALARELRAAFRSDA